MRIASPALARAVGSAALLVALAVRATAAELVIHEIMRNPAAVPDATGEWLELFNPGPTAVDVEGWTLADDGVDRHVIAHGAPLLVPPGGFLVLANDADPAANGGVAAAYAYDGVALANGADELVLRDAAENEVDRVAWDDDAGFPSRPGAAMALVDPALDNGAGASWCAARTPFGAGDLGTPGAPNDCTRVPTLEIFEIQGRGRASPLEGQRVRTAGNVVTAVAADGFFVQTPEPRIDGEIDTSDGLFVFTGRAPGVAAGDLVDVTGEVVEFFGLTELGPGSEVRVVGRGALPEPVAFDAARPSPDPAAPSCAIEYECYEGMRISVEHGTVTGPSQRFASDPVAEAYVVAAPARAFREPGVAFPGLPPPIPTWDGNPEVFELDPDRLGLPNASLVAGSTWRAVGVLAFEFGGWELWPTELDARSVAIPRAVRAPAADELRVGTLNLRRLFDDVDDPPQRRRDGTARDDAVVPGETYRRRRAKLARYVVEALRAPEVLAVQEAEKLGVLRDLAADVARLDGRVRYRALLVEGNDVGTIDVGFLVREPLRVDGVTQLGRDESFADPQTGARRVLHDRPPLLLEGTWTLGGQPLALRVLTLHARSLAGIADPRAGLRVRHKRLAQAQSLAGHVQALQSSDPEVGLLVIGDFNAFDFSDGFADVVGHVAGDFDPEASLLAGADRVDPDLTRWARSLPERERYTFVFRGHAELLDHALTSRTLSPLVRDVQIARGNADAPLHLLDEEGTALRASDHDGLVVYLRHDPDGDGVSSDRDRCPGTVVPEGLAAPSLGVNRHALIDGDRVFDTASPPGRVPPARFTLDQTGGCSCAQIAERLGLGARHAAHGCSTGALRAWLARLAPAPGRPRARRPDALRP